MERGLRLQIRFSKKWPNLQNELTIVGEKKPSAERLQRLVAFRRRQRVLRALHPLPAPHLNAGPFLIEQRGGGEFGLLAEAACDHRPERARHAADERRRADLAAHVREQVAIL